LKPEPRDLSNVVDNSRKLSKPIANVDGILLRGSLSTENPVFWRTHRTKRVWRVKTNNGVIHEVVPCKSYHTRDDFTITSPMQNTFTIQNAIITTTQTGIVRCTFEANAPEKETIRLCDGSSRILRLPNAGGNSIWSEIVSFEVLNSMFNAKLIRTEMELEYWPLGCKITDYSVEMFDQTIGVSVTRAIKFGGTFTAEDAKVLLRKKLDGINVSSRCVVTEQSWSKQMLFVWATDERVADILMEQFALVEDELKSNTFVFVCTSKNAGWIY